MQEDHLSTLLLSQWDLHTKVPRKLYCGRERTEQRAHEGRIFLGAQGTQLKSRMSRVNDILGITANQIYKKQTAYSKLSRVPSRVVAREVSLEGLEGLGLFGSRNGFEGGDEAGDRRTGMGMSSGLADGMGLACNCACRWVRDCVAWFINSVMSR